MNFAEAVLPSRSSKAAIRFFRGIMCWEGLRGGVPCHREICGDPVSTLRTMIANGLLVFLTPICKWAHDQPLTAALSTRVHSVREDIASRYRALHRRNFLCSISGVRNGFSPMEAKNLLISHEPDRYNDADRKFREHDKKPYSRLRTGTVVSLNSRPLLTSVPISVTSRQSRSSNHRGTLLETIPEGGAGAVPAGGARNSAPGRSGHRPRRHDDRRARCFA